jgi:hypothetical protein
MMGLARMEGSWEGKTDINRGISADFLSSVLCMSSIDQIPLCPIELYPE